jgi:hypothetical protein
MKLSPLILLILAAACSNGPNHLGNPLLFPINAINNGIGNAAYNQRRGQVEIIVKSNYPEILEEISNGGGPNLTKAMDVSGVKANERPARLFQLKGDLGLYSQNPEALIVAIMVYGN